MLAVLISLLVLSTVTPFLFRWIGRKAFYVIAVFPAIGFIWLVTNYASFLPGTATGEPHATGPPEVVIPWIPELQINIALRMDPLSALLCILILGVGALILAYCGHYFKKDDDSSDLGAFGAELLAFCAAMFGLVIVDDIILLFIFWELTTILSFLLIGYSGHRIYVRRSALQALIVTTAGGLAMFIGLLTAAYEADSTRISEIVEAGPELLASGNPTVVVAIVLILIGAISKSALIPLHFWLPGAMAAPTPVSAYLHAAAMVKAGLYLIARFAPAFAPSATWQAMVLILGLGTMIVGAYRALRQVDIKLVLAYGTISQLGFLTVLIGIGTQAAMAAGLALLLSHGLFKAALFLVVGIIDHATGTRDVRELSGIGRRHKVLAGAAVITAASMAGLPPLLGFVAKEAAFEAALDYAAGGALSEGFTLGWVVPVVLVLGSILTFAYAARFLWGAFSTKQGVESTSWNRVSPLIMVAPVTLAAATVVGGFSSPVLETLIQPFAEPLEGEAIHFALWHGFTPALAMSVITILLGLALVLGHKWQTRFQNRAGALLPPAFDAERIYRFVLAGIDEVAVAVTGRTQRGSLSFYLIIIFLVATLGPLLVVIASGLPDNLEINWFDSWGQLLAGLAIILGAIGAIRARTRFMAVILVSITGYGLVLIFALQGAPDLALTQLLVESIVLVAVILGLRALPAAIGTKDNRRIQTGRLVLGMLFGAAMFVVALVSMGSRTHAPISLDFPRLAVEGGHGYNIVNVTLVDIRAWDTFGEITVLIAAATGIASLVFVKYREFNRTIDRDVKTGSVGILPRPDDEALHRRAETQLAHKFFATQRRSWLVGSRTQDPARRSIIFEVVTRLIFHTIMVLSIYLLLAGHNLPGGGFAGGLVAGLALTMRYLAGGRYELEEAISTPAGTVLGAGLAVSTLSSMAPLLFGGQVFQTVWIDFDLGILGEHALVSSTIFDIGVYLVVIGLVLDVLRTFGSKIDVRLEERARAQRLAERTVGSDA